MFAEERQEKILEMLKVNKRVSNTELIKKFGVSGTTIRIDLTELEQKGLLSRTHGGAILKEDPVYGEDSISSRREKIKKRKNVLQRKHELRLKMEIQLFEHHLSVPLEVWESEH